MCIWNSSWPSCKRITPIPSRTRRQFLSRQIRCLANRGHGQVAEYSHVKLPHRWWGPRLWKKLADALDPWLVGILTELRKLILALEEQVNRFGLGFGRSAPKGRSQNRKIRAFPSIRADWANVRAIRSTPLRRRQSWLLARASGAEMGNPQSKFVPALITAVSHL
jgi:hypothetical protein